MEAIDHTHHKLLEGFRVWYRRWRRLCRLYMLAVWPNGRICCQHSELTLKAEVRAHAMRGRPVFHLARAPRVYSLGAGRGPDAAGAQTGGRRPASFPPRPADWAEVDAWSTPVGRPAGLPSLEARSRQAAGRLRSTRWPRGPLGWPSSIGTARRGPAMAPVSAALATGWSPPPIPAHWTRPRRWPPGYR